MIKRLLTRMAVPAGFAVLAVACASVADAPGNPTLAPTVPATEQAAASPSPRPDPYVTGTAVRGVMISDPGGFRTCETDAFANVQYGKALELLEAVAGFRLTLGEPVFHSTGEPMAQDDPTLVALPVMRDGDGPLMLGWRHCEEGPLQGEEPSP
jgi:hypothetical protein